LPAWRWFGSNPPYAGFLFLSAAQAGYAPDLNDVEMETIGRDRFLGAAAMAVGAQCVVVTKEVSRPKKQRPNRKVLDVCVTMGVTWIDDFELWRQLDFRIE
jgi:hypothetical protein